MLGCKLHLQIDYTNCAFVEIITLMLSLSIWWCNCWYEHLKNWIITMVGYYLLLPLFLYVLLSLVTGLAT